MSPPRVGTAKHVQTCSCRLPAAYVVFWDMSPPVQELPTANDLLPMSLRGARRRGNPLPPCHCETGAHTTRKGYDLFPMDPVILTFLRIIQKNKKIFPNFVTKRPRNALYIV